MKTNIITGVVAVVVDVDPNGVVDGLVELKRDGAEKPVEVGADAVDVDPNEIGATAAVVVLFVPNGVVVDGPTPNVNEEDVAPGRDVAVVVAGVDVVVPPKENVDDWVDGAVLVDPNENDDGCAVAGGALVDPNPNAGDWVVEVDPNPNVLGWVVVVEAAAAAAGVEPKEKLDVVPVAGVVVAGAPLNPKPPVVPPNGVFVGAVVVPVEPNVNGLAEAVAAGAVAVKPPPNVNGVALVVVAGVADDPPNENIFLKCSN